MWLIASLVLFFVYLAVFGLAGSAAARGVRHIFAGWLTRTVTPKTWSILGLSTAALLAIMVEPLARTGLPSLLGSKFLAWWAVTCLCVGFALTMAFLGAVERSSEPDTVEQPRLAKDGKMDGQALLHVYGQETWHNTVHVLGSRDGLAALEDAVHRAIDDPAGVGATPTVWPSDGEGYRVIVVRAENESFFQQQGAPYFGEECRGSEKPGMLTPAELVEAVSAAIRDADDRKETGGQRTTSDGAG
jgi:hypothetical protein